MRLRRILILLPLFFLLSLAAAAQDAKLTGDELKNLAGDWNGELTYLDYKDDKSKVVLKVRTSNVWEKPKLSRAVVFTEPNGKEIKNSSNLTVTDNGRNLKEDEENWRVVKNNFDRSRKVRVIVLETRAEDNNKPADIRKTLVIRESEYTVTKEVRYLEATDYLFRNEFRFSKLK